MKKNVSFLAICISALLGICANLAFWAGAAQAAISESVAKNAALQMTAALENSTTELQFNYAENIGDGRGITFGAIGFCTGTYDGNQLIKHYTELNPNNNLAKYIPALDAIDAGPHNAAGGDGNPSTVGLSGFIEAVRSNTDPLFRQAQLDMLDELYWDPAVDMANEIGAEYNLTLAYIYDMAVRHGPDGAQEMIDEAGGTPGEGVNEKPFLSNVMSVRDEYLEEEGLGDVDRNVGFRKVLSSGNVNLNTPYSFIAYGDSFTIKAGMYTDGSGTSTTKYTLTVNSGTGDGSYAQGAKVTITADAPATGKVFDKWTGDTSYVASVTSATTTVTMPAKNISLTATYKDVTYALAVGKGSGDGLYAQGAKVTITADAPATGYVFSKWTGDTSYVASVTSATTTVTMPAKNISLTATYTNGSSVTPEKTYYLLIVNQGTGSEAYEPGTRVRISANVTISELVFDKWTGDIQYLDDPSAFTTYVTMPAKHISVTATYRNSPEQPEEEVTYTLTVNSGTGDGSYAQGAKVAIKADAAAGNKAFDKWMGDVQYVASVTSATTIVTMPAKNITLTATYKNVSSNGGTINLPDGTLIKLPDSPKVYVIVGGEKKWISTPEQFEQLGYKWTEVETVTEELLDAIDNIEDSLIRLMGDIKVYLVTNGIMRHIPNPKVFMDYGFSWGDIKDVDQTTFRKYKNAYLIRESGQDEVYFLSPNGVRKHIPTAAIFASYGDKWEDVQIVSKTEMESYPLSNLIRMEGSNDVYVIENGEKRYIPNEKVFKNHGFNWDYVVSVNPTEFNYYKTGKELQ